MNRDEVESLPLRAYRISNGALTSAPNLPTRLKLLNWGENSSTKGPVLIGAKSQRILPLIQPGMGFAKVALDFEHNTVPGSPAHAESKEPRPVAAYGVPKIIPNDGLWLEELEWTPRGKAEAFNFADLSPAVKQDDAGEVVFVHSAALTRNGSVHELSFFSTQPNKEKIMNPETFSVADLAQALGLKADATKAEVLAKLAAFSAAPKADNIIVLSAEMDGKTVTMQPGDVVRELMALRADRAASASREVDALIATFSAEGKVPVKEDGSAYTADELKKLDVTTLKILSANTRPTVPLSPRAVTPRNGSSANSVETFSAAVSEYKTKHNCSFDVAFAAVRKQQGI